MSYPTCHDSNTMISSCLKAKYRTHKSSFRFVIQQRFARAIFL